MRIHYVSESKFFNRISPNILISRRCSISLLATVHCSAPKAPQTTTVHFPTCSSSLQPCPHPYHCPWHNIFPKLVNKVNMYRYWNSSSVKVLKHLCITRHTTSISLFSQSSSQFTTSPNCLSNVSAKTFENNWYLIHQTQTIKQMNPN